MSREAIEAMKAEVQLMIANMPRDIAAPGIGAGLQDDVMDYEQRRIIRAEARQLLDNKHFQEAFDAVELYLRNAALSCDVDNRDKGATDRDQPAAIAGPEA